VEDLLHVVVLLERVDELEHFLRLASGSSVTVCGTYSDSAEMGVIFRSSIARWS
jgi:hypothetical protein